MNLSTIVKNLKLPADARRALDELIATPEAQGFLDRQDDHLVTRRKELKKTIAEADAQIARESAVTWRAVLAAEKAYEVAEAALHEAVRRHRDAASRNYAAGAAPRRLMRAAERELAETRDRRLDEFLRHVANLEEALRLAARSWSDTAPPNILGRRAVRHHSNVAEATAAMQLCRACHDDLLAMAADALTRAAITERLAEWSGKLAAAAARFDLPVPTLDERGEVAPSRGPGKGAPLEVIEQEARRQAREAQALDAAG